MDIIFFAALAFYIFFKLNKQLGKIDEEEKHLIRERLDKRKKQILEIQKKVAEIQKMKVVSSEVVEREVMNDQIVNEADLATKENFLKILQACNISAKFFADGAKLAFEMVIKAFSAGDLKTLKILLDEKLYNGFESVINKRFEQQKTLTTNLIAVEEIRIMSAMIFENIASITVKLISKQINYVSDKNGEIVEGAKDEISKLVDVWTFKKNITSSNPNWIICATSNN